MSTRPRFGFLAALLACGLAAGDEAPRVRLDAGHPWRPPFGLHRVGRPAEAVVEFPAGRPARRYSVSIRLRGEEIALRELTIPERPPFRARVPVAAAADELVVLAAGEAGAGSGPEVIARQAVALPEVEAEAIARPDQLVNPVDLGTVLVPSGWLLLGPGRGAGLDLAAFSRTGDRRACRVEAWFQSRPAAKTTAALDLPAGRRADRKLRLPEPPPAGDRDVLRVVLAAADGAELWRKAIPVMIVRDPPKLPAFGATALKLRFDPPISVRDPATGTFSTLKYEDGWDTRLDDVVVALPNGARFVFWRGSSYIPFWAGMHNTGLSMEWAENLAPPADAVDCVEPLMDKELRYGRVEVVEATAARVHVRWRYQSTDLHYRVWGDEAVEDYYFYPDGFGTRVLTLKSDPATDYELSEFILLAPQDAYPFAVLPKNPIDVLPAEGPSRSIGFPIDRAAEAELRRSTVLPAAYRVRLHEEDALAAVYFNPRDPALPPVIFAPFTDGGEVVTPAYWGSHWPLARGNATGSAIDDRIHLTPSHTSLMSWARSKPGPISTATLATLDALGRSRTMAVRRWAWLIGMSDAPDDRLRAWARSYAEPPSLELRGARPDLDAYAPERRALRLAVEARDVEIEVKPRVPAVNPVFELIGTPAGQLRVTLADRVLDPGRYAWDGRTLWLDATLASATRLRLTFGDR